MSVSHCDLTHLTLYVDKSLNQSIYLLITKKQHTKADKNYLVHWTSRKENLLWQVFSKGPFINYVTLEGGGRGSD